MKKALKIILFLLVWAAIAAVIFIVAVFADLPALTGFCIFAGLFLLWLLFIILRKLILRRRAKKRVENLIGEEAPDASSDKPSLFSKFGFLARRGGDGFARQFYSLLELLKKSHLKVQGDPIYVLPWYLMLGVPESGKKTTLKHARLPAPAFDYDLLEGEEWNCHPYNQAIIIDAPGKCLRGRDRAARHEWHDFLDFLGKKRGKEPLNGIVATISIKRLAEAKDHELIEDGKLYRARIDEIMKRLKISAPVYLMITGFEGLEGFSEWCSILPEKTLSQAMGYTAGSVDKDIIKFGDKAIDSIIERIKDLLLINISKTDNAQTLLQLPGGVDRLKDRMLIFINGLFQINPYQETPSMRGIYFSGVNRETDDDDGRGDGFFLQQFFTRIIPADRRMISTLESAEAIRERTKKFALSGWTLSLVVAVALLWWSHHSNLSYVNNITGQHGGSFVKQTSLRDNADNLYNFSGMVKAVGHEVEGWWMPWTGFGKPASILKLEKLYVERVNDYILKNLDRRLYKELDNALSGSRKSRLDDEKTAEYIDLIVRRINALNMYLKGADMQELDSMPNPFPAGSLYFDEEIDENVARTVSTNYFQSLIWSLDSDAVLEQLDKLKKYLSDVLVMSRKNMSWIIPLANRAVDDSPAFHLASYWSGSGTLDSDVYAQPAFTLEGKAFIDNFITQLIDANPNSDELRQIEASFKKKYRVSYYRIWEDFALNFNRGMSMLRGKEEWISMIDTLSSRRNPYFNFLNLMARQLDVFSNEPDFPEWAELVVYYQRMKAYGPDDTMEEGDGKQKKVLSKLALKAVGALGPLGKAISGAGKKGMKIKKKLKGGKKGAADRELVLEEAGKTLGDFRKALIDVAFNAGVRSVSFEAMRNLFANPDNPGGGTGPEARCFKSIYALQVLIGKETKLNRAFWRVYGGAMDVIYDYMLQEASCEIQKKWNDNLLVEIENVPDYKLNEFIFGPSGKAWEFVNVQIPSFMGKVYGKGYTPTRAHDRNIFFKPELMTFLSIGADNSQPPMDKYPVKITALPTSVNDGAKTIPRFTILKMSCAENPQIFRNYNFSASTIFNWSPSCGDVSLTVNLGEFNLERTYFGKKSFPLFLQDFNDGSLRLMAEDFPEYSERLENLGVKHIDVRYQLAGHGAVIASQNEAFASGSAPKSVTFCWKDSPLNSMPKWEKYKKVVTPFDDPASFKQKVKKPKEDMWGSESLNDSYGVQVASHRDMEDALAEAKKIVSKGYAPVVVWMTDSSGALWYTVFLSEYQTSMSDARLAAEGYDGPTLIRPLNPGFLSERRVEG